MPDIFISYSSKDREQAELLTELLASAGLSVWLDKSALNAASSWSKEIVQAINECRVFVVLLSPSSLESHNVIKEVSLASEKRKKILPLDLEPVQLTDDFEYQLAGIQRAPMSNIDSIIRALSKLGLEATGTPQAPKIVKESDGKKSLMILPFEDLSPTGDNGWFADGLASELVNALSNIKALRVIDWNTSRGFKNKHVPTTTLARELEVRYFIEGQVRKFGNQIKISVTLLDIETGDHLWQNAHKGTLEDVFEIQEQVALKVAEGLKLHLTSDEKHKLAERGTLNAEAYELFLRAEEYFRRQMKQGFELAVHLLSQAIALDTSFAKAYRFKAGTLVALYRTYDGRLALLNEAESLCKEALRLKSDLVSVYGPLSQIYMLRGQLAEAEETAREFVRKEPQNFHSHFALGFFYANTGQHDKAIAPYERAVELKFDDLPSLFNLVISCDSAGEHQKRTRWVTVALPYFERHLRLHPDDENHRVNRANLLEWSGKTDEARVEARKLMEIRDGNSLYNTACLFRRLGDEPEALRTFRKSIEAGFRSIAHLKEFLSDQGNGIIQLAGTPEYEEVKQMVEVIEREQEQEAKNA